MKKAWLVGAVILALGASSAATFAQGNEEAQLYEAAKKEGSVTWYTAHYDQNMTAQIGAAFTKKYPGITVNGIKATAQVSFQRLLLDLKAGQSQADVFSSTDVSHFPHLKQMDALVQYTPENEKHIVEAFRNIDPDGYYHTTLVGLITLLYNTDKVTEAEAPKNWPDLKDPKWKGKVTFGDPNYSGMVGVWTVAMANTYGWSFFEDLKPLDPQIGRSIDDAVTLLNSGERVVAMGDPGTALQSAAKGNPVAVVYPTDGAVVVRMPSAVIKGSKSPNAAKLFMNFLLSKEAMEIATAGYQQSLRPDVPPPPGAKSLAEVAVIAPTPEQIGKSLPENKEKWRDTFGM
ncbi:ABC transporter substrate-binding protein [Rhodoligotrophos defluvii]|uniref:ABC transporter substrate-binding protein n=1 Tax=Rhodoligotrophos defluvii TaxID=2561934 RepID=UPI0010C9E511|nr:extracellular solute-binding protein [Rhodoligotrophos defluvii]